MRNYLFLLLLTMIIASCGNNKKDEKSETQAPDSVALQYFYGWEATLNDSTGKLEMKKKEGAGPDSISVGAIISYLNRTNTHVQLELVKVSNDTVYVKIPDATYLTQQMGSTGPVLYFSEVVYNLTELAGIKYVNLDFEEGDHASPATLNRDSFNDQ
ncbi:MAG TPA: hypothetical protein VMZ03_08405 [Chitinophagaceae bacterium]|nr:hypothetical protein [Chitinophagaceae bacterium]